jgi:hypothetical protein
MGLPVVEAGLFVAERKDGQVRQIFCRDCKNRIALDRPCPICFGCKIAGLENAPDPITGRIRHHYMNEERMRNKNQELNCSDYHRKWYKFWAAK